LLRKVDGMGKPEEIEKRIADAIGVR